MVLNFHFDTFIIVLGSASLLEEKWYIDFLSSEIIVFGNLYKKRAVFIL